MDSDNFKRSALEQIQIRIIFAAEWNEKRRNFTDEVINQTIIYLSKILSLEN